jgi:hypothetical protein
MKNLIILFCVSILTVLACKKKEDPPVNKLITGLDPSIKLPNAETTGALSYIEGYIDGERFCLVEGRDSVKLIDYASPLFGYDYQKEWVDGVGGSWTFDQGDFRTQEPVKKKWYITFSLPTFSGKRDTSQFTAFKRKYGTPGIFTNFDRANLINGQDQFSLSIDRQDIFNGQWNILGLTTWGDVAPGVPMNQTGSYIKLVSTNYYRYIQGTNYHYEMIYEFDLKLTGNRHLTKGRMKTWVTSLKF